MVKNALTVDVYEYGAFGPIFRTRGGQTSNPYEGEVRTQYYQDDKGNYPVIMDATMQIEVPQIDVDVNTVGDIPTGSAANYTLRLSNASEIGEDVAYKLFFLDETNPYGAQLTMDGKTLTAEGRLIKVPGNQTLTKTLQLKRYDSYFLTLDIYGRAEEKDKDGNVIAEADADKAVEFKVYDASTGTIYPVVNTSAAVTFEDNKLLGLYGNPVVLTASTPPPFPSPWEACGTGWASTPRR